MGAELHSARSIVFHFWVRLGVCARSLHAVQAYMDLLLSDEELGALEDQQFDIHPRCGEATNTAAHHGTTAEV